MPRSSEVKPATEGPWRNSDPQERLSAGIFVFEKVRFTLRLMASPLLTSMTYETLLTAATHPPQERLIKNKLASCVLYRDTLGAISCFNLRAN